jgi:hypothetical protein
VNAKRSVLIEEMEHVLKFGWMIKAEAIVSAKLRASSATQCYKKAPVQLRLGQFFTKQAIEY